MRIGNKIAPEDSTDQEEEGTNPMRDCQEEAEVEVEAEEEEITRMTINSILNMILPNLSSLKRGKLKEITLKVNHLR